MTGLALQPLKPRSDRAAAQRGPGVHRLLELDPELGRLLSPDDLARALPELRVRVHRRERGPWPIKAMPAEVTAQHLGVLVLDGVIASDTVVEDVISTELLGAGDVVRPWPLDGAERLLNGETRWAVLADCRVALLDQRVIAALSHYPAIYAVLSQRTDLRGRRLATAQAIAQINRVDRRVLNVLWHLAERWGRVTADGVLIPLDLSHRLLGQLVGARRPTVSTAVAQLARDGALSRRTDGAWVLHGEAPCGQDSAPDSVLSRRHLLVEQRRQATAADEIEGRLRRLRREADALRAALDLADDEFTAPEGSRRRR
jgi:CRP/FNR family transcriptional regulator, cyclic AMP receptor protein